ncbi:MAG TPA: hypothetical protein VIX15_10970 [Streptosporangiaceae bacterium]
MTTGIAALIVWLFTASIGAYMLRTWIARGGLRRQRTTGVGAPPGLVFSHPCAALSGLAIWIAYLASGVDALAWLGVLLIATAITLGISMVTLWTPYPVRPDVAHPAEPERHAAADGEPDPLAVSDPFTVTDEMIASLLARPYQARRRRRLELVPLVPVIHGFAAIATFVLAVVTAISARLGTPPIGRLGRSSGRLEPWQRS